ncbi:MAG: hypothetical protein HKN41_03435 [Ilumatobacter sp.]|nr:hypothetical protein [Ilumatobacter sp.]
MEQRADPVDDVRLPAATAAQFGYHARMSAVFAVAGASEESESESVLAWAILATAWPGAAWSVAAVASELVGQDQVGLSEAHRDRAHRKASAQALELEAHYVSCGQHDIASLYASVADDLQSTVDALAN